MAGLDLTVSCKRKEDRDTVKKHLGKEATALERKGVETELGNYNRTIENTKQLEIELYRGSRDLAKELQELRRLELQKQELDHKRQLELNKQHLKEQENQRQARLHELEQLQKLALMQQEQIRLAEQKKLEQTRKAELEIMKLKKPADNYITADSRYKLFDVAREHKEFFTKQTTGDYEYWASRNGDVEVHKTHVNINQTSDENIKLALDVAVSQFGDKLKINGSAEFIKATIELIANDERYAKISLDDPEQQESLASKRLDIEIENAVDLDLEDMLDLEITDERNLELGGVDDEVEEELDRGWSM
jgi:TolA-binding protein